MLRKTGWIVNRVIDKNNKRQKFNASSQTRARTHLLKRIALGELALIASLLLSGFTAEAQNAMQPDVVKLPAGMNLGVSSFL